MTPIWATLVVAVIAVVGPVLSYRAAMKSTNAVRLTAVEANSTANRAIEQARDTAAASNATAEKANALAASRSDRELTMQVLAMAQSRDPLVARHGEALLVGLTQMPGLSPDAAVMVQAVTRPQIEGTLSVGRRVEDIEGEEVEFVFDLDEPGEGDDGEEAGEGIEGPGASSQA